MKQTNKTSARSNGQDAISLLTEDHKKVRKLFKEFEKIKDGTDSNDKKSELVNQICTELTIHAQIEEEIFYPAVREAIDEDELMDEAEEEHASAKDLIAQLEDMEPEDEHYAAKVTVLGEYVDHHIDEEQGQMFPKVKKAKVDTAFLGVQIMQLKNELQKGLGVEDSKMRVKSSRRNDDAKSVHRER